MTLKHDKENMIFSNFESLYPIFYTQNLQFQYIELTHFYWSILKFWKIILIDYKIVY